MTTAEATTAKAAADRIVADITVVVGDKKIPIDTTKIRALDQLYDDARWGYQPVVDTTDITTLLDGLAARSIRRPSMRRSGRTAARFRA